MNKKEDDFHKKLLATFRVEAAEHITAITSGLIELEKLHEPQRQMEIIESIFREAHSFKGAARVVNMTEVETICQKVENIFASLKRNEVPLTPELLDTIHRAIDALAGIHSAPQSTAIPAPTSSVPKFPEAHEGQEKETEVTPKPAAESASSVMAQPLIPNLSETVRISTAKLDALFLQVEELLSSKLAARQRSIELHEISGALAGWKKRWTRILPDLRGMEKSFRGNGEEKNPRIQKLFEFVQWNSEFVKSLQNQIEGTEKTSKQDQRLLDTLVDNLLREMKTVLMLPCSSLLDMFPKFLRDLSRDRGKDVELVIRGGEMEIDRRILEEMKDPLIHLVRNCIDHGIERKEERQARGKVPRGVVTMTVAQKEGGKFEVLVSDDGAGIDIESVRAAALKAGMISHEEASKRAEQEVLSLIFQSGISTSPMITELSGRGLGLAIVLEKVEKLGGRIVVENHPGRGTAFRIVLPVTLTTSRGILVRVGDHHFIIPMINIERVMRVGKEDVRTVENRETILYGGQAIALARLANVLGLNPKESGQTEKIPVILMGTGNKQIAFAVDQVENEQEFLVKSLGPQLSRIKNIASATILSTGKMVPILNALDLMKSAVKGAAVAPVPLARVEEREQKRKSILVVEDSITSRTLLKNILEASGFEVKTAVDGLEAFTILRTEPFDLVVSDVDMPRMNGFDLTERIRGDRRFSEIPVVLVTALESREDRERGVDVGANAYIVKSSFDQENLLGIIRRLLG